MNLLIKINVFPNMDNDDRLILSNLSIDSEIEDFLDLILELELTVDDVELIEVLNE